MIIIPREDEEGDDEGDHFLIWPPDYEAVLGWARPPEGGARGLSEGVTALETVSRCPLLSDHNTGGPRTPSSFIH